MINNIQKILYKVSNIAPVMIFLGVSLYMQGISARICVVLVVMGLASVIYTVFFIKRCEKVLPVLHIKVESISANDEVVVAYLLTYLVPMIGVIWKENQYLWIVLLILAVIILMKINVLSFNPILLFIGYHCYKVSLSTGVSDCVVISKQKRIRNRTQMKEMLRIEDFLMIDGRR